MAIPTPMSKVIPVNLDFNSSSTSNWKPFNTGMGFWTNDIGTAFLEFSTELDLTGTVASIVLENQYDKSLVQKTITEITSSPFYYQLGDEIQHEGRWFVQISVKKGEETIVSNSFAFMVNASIGHGKVARLVSIETFETLATQLTALQSSINDYLTTAQESEAIRISTYEEAVLAEQERKDAEDIRKEDDISRGATASSDHDRANADHSTAVTDHSTSSSDHGIAQTDHAIALADHGVATTDHTTSSADHTTALADHSTALSDHESYEGLLTDGVLTTNIENKLLYLETTYAPDLVSVKEQLADIELNKADLADLPSSAYAFKGSTTFALLPATLNTLGDVYYVTDGTPQNYAWTGTTWTPIGNGALADKSITNGKIADKTITKIKLNPTAISKYPFQPNANFDLVKSNVHYDAYELNNALLDIELYGADLDEDYYINSLFSGYITSLSGNRTYVGVKRKSDGVTVCQYVQAVLHTADSAVVFMLSALNGSGITGKATVNFSKIGLMGTLGDIQTHNYAPNFDSLGLSKECIKNGNTKTALDTKLSNVSYAQVTSKPVDALSIVAPSVVHGVVGHNTNINLDNVLLNGDYYNAERFILTSCGTVEGEHERIPTVAGEVTNQFRYYLGDSLYKSKNLTFKTVADTAGSGTTKKVIIIGDSTTDSGVPSAELLNLFDTDVMNVELLGTRGTAPALHEGRFGWTTTDYLTVTESNGSTNAFYNPGTSTFDFSYYMAQQGYAGVDVVFINLGINDRSKSIPEATTVANYTAMINSIKAYNPNIKIIVVLTNLCTRFPNQWGYTGGTGRKNGLLLMIKALLTAFENRENENIFIAPVHMYLNAFWDMQYAEMALSSRNPKTFFYAIDNSHPSTIGYNKVADCYYNVLKYIASLG